MSLAVWYNNLSADRMESCVCYMEICDLWH